MTDTTTRTPLFSVTLDDCRVETFSVSGAGGQHRDRTSNGVRITHEPSGATGRGVESRSQLTNKREAFKKMAASPQFQFWASQKRREMQGAISPAAYAAMEVANPDRIRVETKTDGKWVEVPFDAPLDGAVDEPIRR